MLKQITALEVKLGERLYQLVCEADSPIGEVHDVLQQMKSYIVERINQAHADSLPKEPQMDMVENG